MILEIFAFIFGLVLFIGFPLLIIGGIYFIAEELYRDYWKKWRDKHARKN